MIDCNILYVFSDSKGKIIKAAPFQGWLNAGTVARVEPHRKWFGEFLSFNVSAQIYSAILF